MPSYRRYYRAAPEPRVPSSPVPRCVVVGAPAELLLAPRVALFRELLGAPERLAFAAYGAPWVPEFVEELEAGAGARVVEHALPWATNETLHLEAVAAVAEAVLEAGPQSVLLAGGPPPAPVAGFASADAVTDYRRRRIVTEFVTVARRVGAWVVPL